MADKFAIGNGGFMDVAAPLALGVASMLDPALARGASAITTAMSLAGRNKRLKEITDIEAKKEARSSDEYEWQKTQRPYAEAKNRYQPLSTGGGSTSLWDHANPTAPVQEIAPPWEGSPRQLQAHQNVQRINRGEQVEYQKAIAPIQLNNQIAAQNNAAANARTNAEFNNALPPSQHQLFQERNSVIAQMKGEMQAAAQLAKQNSEDWTREDEEMLARQLHQKYAPRIQAIEQRMGQNVGQPFQAYDAPPPGYRKSKLTHPQYGPIWTDRSNPNADYWYPKVPYMGW